MTVATSPSFENQDAALALRDVLERGLTGCLSVVSFDAHKVFVMQGAVLAAHGPDDGIWVVCRLVNNGVITERQGVSFTRAIERGARYEEILLGHVPDTLLMDVLAERFKQDLLDFICLFGKVRFEPLDAVFVDNVQVVHESFALLDDLVELRERIASLRERRAQLTVRPGPSMARRPEELRLLDLCDPSITLSDLVVFSPYEEGPTLLAVRSMLENGSLVSDQGIRFGSRRGGRSAPAPAPEYATEELFAIDEQLSPSPVQNTEAFTLRPEDSLMGTPMDEFGEMPGEEDARGGELDLFSDGFYDLGAPRGDEPVVPAATDDLASDEDPDALEVVADPATLDAFHDIFPTSEDDPRPPPSEDEPPSYSPLSELSSLPMDGLLSVGSGDGLSIDDEAEPVTALGAEAVDAAERVAAAELEAEPSAGPASEPSAEPTSEPSAEVVAEVVADPAAEEPRADAPAAEPDGERPSEAASGAEADLVGVGDGDSVIDLDLDRPPAEGLSAEALRFRASLFRQQAHSVINEDELAFFGDYDQDRGLGAGGFLLEDRHLDVVDLRSERVVRSGAENDSLLPDIAGDPDLVEMGEVEDAPIDVDEKVVALNFGAPRLEDGEARQKLAVANEVVGQVAMSLDRHAGPGSGQVSVQLLLDGAPLAFAPLFHGVEVARNGRFDLEAAMRNLGRRPDAERRSLLDRGLMDLIERALSSAAAGLSEAELDEVLAAIAGYQARLRN